MKQFEIKTSNTIPLNEQETIISHDKNLKEWHIYTNNPVHAKKYEDCLISSSHYGNSKTYHETTGELIGIEGKISGSVSIRKKKEITAEQRKALSDRMKKVNQTKASII